MCAPDAPDTSRQDAVAEKIQHLNEEQFSWVKQQWEADAPARARAAETADQVSRAQLDTMRKQGALADESAADYRRIYRPEEERMMSEARSFDSIARQNEAAGKAVADVRQQSAIARGAAERNLASMGVNPSDGAYGSMNAELANSEMLNAAGSANAARERVQTVGRALRADAIGLGRGVVGSQGTQAGLTLTAGSQGLGSATVPLQVNQAGVGMVQQAAGQATNGLGAAGNIYQNSSKMAGDASAAGSQATAGLAGAAMTAAAIF